MLGIALGGPALETLTPAGLSPWSLSCSVRCWASTTCCGASTAWVASRSCSPTAPSCFCCLPSSSLVDSQHFVFSSSHALLLTVCMLTLNWAGILCVVTLPKRSVHADVAFAGLLAVQALALVVDFAAGNLNAVVTHNVYAHSLSVLRVIVTPCALYSGVVYVVAAAQTLAVCIVLFPRRALGFGSRAMPDVYKHYARGRAYGHHDTNTSAYRAVAHGRPSHNWLWAVD